MAQEGNVLFLQGDRGVQAIDVLRHHCHAGAVFFELVADQAEMLNFMWLWPAEGAARDRQNPFGGENPRR